MKWRTPMITQSVGVPRMMKVRSAICLQRSGSCSVIECEAPLWFTSGAKVQTSEDSFSAIWRSTSRPSAPQPSSLVMRMRMSAPASGPADSHLSHEGEVASGALAARAGEGLRPRYSARPSPGCRAPHVQPTSPPGRGAGGDHSLVRRPLCSRSCGFLDLLEAAHVGDERVGDDDRAVGLLVVLQDRDQRAPDREAGAVERVHVAQVLCRPCGR